MERPEIYPLPGSVKLYRRHVLVCTGTGEWPSHIDTGGGFLQALSEAMAARQDAMPLPVKVTACDEPGRGAGHDLLVFPDQVRYLGVRESDFPALIEDHLVGDRVSERIRHEPLAGRHVFVCTHGARDERCGLAGPPLIEGFRAALEARGLAQEVAVRATSHVGGHRYAGNVLIYPGGDWYGYVTPAHVEVLVDQHILAGEIVRELWRGRMGLTPEEQIRLVAGRKR
jgi:(2Fe-2S) ferredoxin